MKETRPIALKVGKPDRPPGGPEGQRQRCARTARWPASTWARSWPTTTAQDAAPRRSPSRSRCSPAPTALPEEKTDHARHPAPASRAEDLLPDAEYARVRRKSAAPPCCRSSACAGWRWARSARSISRPSRPCCSRSRRCCSPKRAAPAQIADELDAYNPLIPQGARTGGHDHVRDRGSGAPRRHAGRLSGVEDDFFVQVGDERISGRPEGDVERTRDDGKTSSVHFVRFPLEPLQIAHFNDPATQVLVGCSHEFLRPPGGPDSGHPWRIGQGFRSRRLKVRRVACGGRRDAYIARPSRPALNAGPFRPRGDGELAEWLKAHAWKACLRETVTRVRIPHSPPSHALRGFGWQATPPGRSGSGHRGCKVQADD